MSKFAKKIIDMKRFLIIGILIVTKLFAVSQTSEKVMFSGNYIGDFLANTTGGIKTGCSYLGYAGISMELNSDNFDWWKGGSLYIKGANTHGGTPSEKLIGDLHIVDNIEAGNHSFLQEFWFKQSFEKLDITIGLQDFNANFATSSESSMFLHSTFGINSVIANNVPTPIFPLSGLGIEVLWKITNEFHWQIGVYDGNVGDFETNPYNLKWHIGKDDGGLFASEFHYNNKAGNLKIGGFYHSAESKYGFYFIGNHRISDFGIFEQIAFSPQKSNANIAQFGGGVKFYNLFADNDKDEIGLAFVSNLLSDSKRHETIIELSYKYQFHDNIYFQPDIQYVFNPAGTDEILKNALVVILRLGCSF